MTPRIDYRALLESQIGHLLRIEAGLARGQVPHSLLELVKTRASQINGCARCIHLHVTDALRAGEAVERLALLPAWRESSLYTEAERAALEWTEQVTLLAGSPPSDAAYVQLQAHFEPAQIAELTLAISMINLWNRMAVALRAAPANTPLTYVTPGSEPRVGAA